MSSLTFTFMEPGWKSWRVLSTLVALWLLRRWDQRTNQQSISYVWESRRQVLVGSKHHNTKLAVCETCVLTSLLYVSEMWTLYQHQIKVLERFHQYCLRHLLGIKWEYLTPDTEVLQKAKSTSISMHVMKNQMRRTGHDRLPKRIFYGELSEGKRPQQRAKEKIWG